jgi:hypothetical protein
MAFSFGWRGPNIVKDGLVLYLNAASPTSYNSVIGGTVWRDISGNNNNCTLINGTTYSSANGGAMVFDGSNDYVLSNNIINVSNRFTVNAWVRLNFTTPQPTNFSNRVTLISNCYPYTANKGFLMVASANNGSDIFISLGNDQKYAVSTTGYVSANQNYMVTATVNAGDSNIKLYYNGLEVNYAVQTDGNINLAYDVGSTQIGFRSGADIMNGNLYNMQIYNRALSATEVLQNYNATKTRFGL